MNVRRQTLTLLVTGGLATSLGACKGDDSGDDGNASASETDPGSTSAASNTMSSSSPTTTVTTEDPTETDPTVDPSETDPTDPTTDPDTSTGEPAELAAYRFNSIAVHDPHFFITLAGDVTENPVNSDLTSALNTDGAGDGDTPDGFLDLGLVLIFRPLDQADGAGGDFNFANAHCTAPAETASCDLFEGTTLYETTYTNNAAGPCLEPDPMNLSTYPDPPEPPTATTGPCFESEGTSVVLQTATFSLPLGMALVSAQYVGDPAGNLVEGNIQGFLTQADADATTVQVPLFGEQQLSSLLHAEDKDGDGWWMHVSFTAVPVDWTGG